MSTHRPRDRRLRLRLRRARGQGLVELAISATLWVLIVVGGLYFAEVIWQGLKVQEAGQFAMMELARTPSAAIGRTGTSQAPAALALARQRIESRYSDLNGETAMGGNGASQLFTRTTVGVTCGATQGLDTRFTSDVAIAPNAEIAQRFAYEDHRAALANPNYGALFNRLAASYPEGTGAGADSQAGGCAVSGRLLLQNPNIAFVKDAAFGGSATAPLVDALTLCASGRPVNGQCAGRLGILMGDFGLVPTTGEPQLAGDCIMLSGLPGDCGPNTTYRDLVRDLYEANGFRPNVAVAQVQLVEPAIPALNGLAFNNLAFYMSFAGAEHGFMGRAPLMPAPGYNTSGAFPGTPETPSRGNGTTPQMLNGYWLGQAP